MKSPLFVLFALALTCIAGSPAHAAKARYYRVPVHQACPQWDLDCVDKNEKSVSCSSPTAVAHICATGNIEEGGAPALDEPALNEPLGFLEDAAFTCDKAHEGRPADPRKTGECDLWCNCSSGSRTKAPVCRFRQGEMCHEQDG